MNTTKLLEGKTVIVAKSLYLQGFYAYSHYISEIVNTSQNVLKSFFLRQKSANYQQINSIGKQVNP